MRFWQNTVNIGISDARNEISFPYAQSIGVLVRGNSGNIQITTTNSEQIEVKLHINGTNASQQLADTQIQFDSTQQLLEVILGDSQLEMHTSIELSICAPAFTTIHTSSTAGNITINAPECMTIHTNTMAGNITINAPECTAIHTSTTTGILSINSPVAVITYHTPVPVSTTPVPVSTTPVAVSTTPVPVSTTVDQPSQKSLLSYFEWFTRFVSTLSSSLSATIDQGTPKNSIANQPSQTSLLTYFQLLFTRISTLSSRVFTTTNQSTPENLSGTATSPLSIAYLFSLFVGVSTAFVYPLAWYRTDMNEDSDKFLVLVAVCVIGLTYLLIHYLPNVVNRLITHIGTKIALVLLVLLFFGIGFREEDFYTDFLGFNSIVLICTLGLILLIHQLRRKSTSEITKLLGWVLSIYVLLMGINAVLIRPQSSGDVFFIFNELLTPITQLKPYSTFIPQYVNLFQYFTMLLDFLKVTQYPQLTVNMLHVFLQFISIATIGSAVYINYKYMYIRSISVAILMTVPMFIMSSRPFWDTVAIYQGYYVLPFFTYSLVPLRMFTVFGGGSLCLWIIRNATDSTKRMIGMSLLCGVVASIGIYNSNDFGVFTWVGIGAAIVFQPFQSIKNRLTMLGLFLIGTIIGIIGLITINTDIYTVNPNYLFWFQRNFASGFGGLPIGFPGNGLMLIIGVFATWFCTLKIHTMLQQQREHYVQDSFIAPHFATLMFIATVSVVSLPYYTNHSVMSFQGSTFYIFLCISLFLLYQLLKRMQLQKADSPLRFSDMALRIFVVLPIAIALLYTPVYNRINQSIPLKEIISADPNAQEYNELGIAGVSDRYAALQPLQLKIAYAGSYANIIELYTNIPAANIFDHPVNFDISADAAKMYCNQMEQFPYDLYLTNTSYVCENMTIGVSGDFGLAVYYRPDFPQTHPEQWKQLRDIAHICPILNGAVTCTDD